MIDKRSSSFYGRGGLSHINRAHSHIHNLVLASESPQSREICLPDEAEGGADVSVLLHHQPPRHGHSSSIETQEENISQFLATTSQSPAGERAELLDKLDCT